MKKIFLPLYQKAVTGLHDLQYIFFELTHRCNLSCLHCGSDCIKDSNTSDLEFSDVIRTLNQIKSKYNSHKIFIVLSGGEPLCYPDLFKLGKQISKMEFPWGMVSNGYSWTPKTIKNAASAGLSSITISLDGFAENHNWLRGKKDSFEKTISTIKMLINNPCYKEMDIITCVNKRNINELDDFYDYIKKIGIKKWRLFIISPIGRAIKYPELFLSGTELKLLFAKIIQFKNQNEISINFSESGYLGHQYENKVRDHIYFCRAGINVAGVMVNGDILACPNIDRRFKQGNINEDSFVDVWENQFQVFRNRSWMRTDECKTCKEWKLCKGNSFHLWDIDNKKTKMCHYKLISKDGKIT